MELVLERTKALEILPVSDATMMEIDRGSDRCIAGLRLLLAFPELKTDEGPVRGGLQRMGAGEEALSRWHEIVHMAIEPDEDEGY